MEGVRDEGVIDMKSVPTNQFNGPVSAAGACDRNTSVLKMPGKVNPTQGIKGSGKGKGKGK